MIETEEENGNAVRDCGKDIRNLKYGSDEKDKDNRRWKRGSKTLGKNTRNEDN